MSSARGPLLYGLIAVLIGVGGAALLALTLGTGGSPVGATASPTITAVGSGSPSPLESPLASLPTPSLVASLPPTAGPVATPSATPQAATPRPTATPNTSPTILAFEAPKTEDCTNSTAGTITVSWQIANATGVSISIDGPGIYDSYPGTAGTIDLPFGCSQQQLSHTYTLRTTGGSGTADKLTRTVTTKAPKVKVFTLAAPDCNAPSGSVGIALTYEVVAATGAQLKIDGAIYANYNGKTSSPGLTIPYDCTKASQTFVLTTTGGYGQADKQKIVLER